MHFLDHLENLKLYYLKSCLDLPVIRNCGKAEDFDIKQKPRDLGLQKNQGNKRSYHLSSQQKGI